MIGGIKLEYSKDNFLNRELSWLEFNGRVLEQAEDKTNPLLERLKFLSITSSNLDEFFMIRVAGLKAQIQSEYNQQDISGLTPKEQLQKVEKSTIELVKSQYAIYNNKLLKELKKEKIEIIDYSELTKREEEISAIEKRITDLKEYDKICKQRKEQLKNTTQILDEILSEGTISDINLRMLVKRIFIHQNEDKSLDIRFEMNGEFNGTVSVFIEPTDELEIA